MLKKALRLLKAGFYISLNAAAGFTLGRACGFVCIGLLGPVIGTITGLVLSIGLSMTALSGFFKWTAKKAGEALFA